jgi:hypothetical protein
VRSNRNLRQQFLKGAECLLQTERAIVYKQQNQLYREEVSKIWMQHRVRFDTVRKPQQAKRAGILGAYKSSNKQAGHGNCERGRWCCCRRLHQNVSHSR